MEAWRSTFDWAWPRVLLVATAATMFFAAIFIVPAFTASSNCGGNSAALSDCALYLCVVANWQYDHPNEVLQPDKVDEDMRRAFADLANSTWVDGKFFARLDGVRIDPNAPRRLLIVCDRAYDNVPRHTFWSSPMMHAGGYSTGEKGLITPNEFARLDLSDFVDLRAKYAAETDLR